MIVDRNPIAHLILFVGLAFLCTKGQAYTKFGFLLSPPTQQKLEKQEKFRHLSFFKNLERKIDSGVRFGLNKTVHVAFSGKTQARPTCYGKNLIHTDKEKRTLILPQNLQKKITNHQIYRTIPGKNCSYFDALAKGIERALRKLPGSVDLSRPLTRKELQVKYDCLQAKERGKIREFRFNREFKKLCQKSSNYLDRREELKRYRENVKDLTYNAHMQFDATSLTDASLSDYPICQTDYRPTKVLNNGKKIKMLGMAIVYMTPGFSTSVAGHMAERYVYCLDNQVKDILFEYTQLTSGEIEGMNGVTSEQIDNLPSEYLNSLKGSIFMKVKMHPANNELGNYGFFQLQTNRSVIEMWPAIGEKESYKGLQRSLHEYRKQNQKIENQEPLEEYSLLNNNCTHPIRERLEKFGEEFEVKGIHKLLPHWIFSSLKNKNLDRIIIYPSQRLLRQYRMLKKGESLFWENTTFWSKASPGDASKGSSILLYPETHGPLKNILVKPTFGAINMASGALKVIEGLAKAPINWLSQLAGLEKLESQTTSAKREIGQGIRGVGLSLTEMLGLRMRYPSPTKWRREEIQYIYQTLDHQDPKIVDYLYKKVEK